MTAEVVDVRPDRFLRAMRDTGDWAKACEQAKLSTEEAEKLCSDNPKFDLASVECQLEFIEDQMVQQTEAAIALTRQKRDAKLAELRDKAMTDFRARHPNGC